MLLIPRATNADYQEKGAVMGRRRFATAIALAAGLALAPAAMDGSAAAERITVVIPNPSAINVFPMWVAIGEGYFADEGLEINVEAVDGSAQVLQGMAAGQAEIGLPGPAPVLAARARGVDVVFIYNHFAQSVFGLVVREESDYQTPADLKGTTIGVGTADGAEVGFTRAILSDLGMVEGEDYEFLPVGDGGPATAGFERGDIEAYAAAVSDAAILNARGLRVREITPEEYLAYFGNGYAAMRSFIDERPEIIEAFGRALVRGVEFGMDPANQERVLEHTTAGNPQEGEDPAFAAALLEAIKGRMTPADPDKGWGYQPPEHWELWHQSQLETGALSEPLPDLSAAYTNQFVEAWNAGQQ
jgi:NitT/TauT family transport system substrate-binding protein